MVKKVTHYQGKSRRIIDSFFINDITLVNDCKVFPYPYSNNCIVAISLKLRTAKNLAHTIKDRVHNGRSFSSIRDKLSENIFLFNLIDIYDDINDKIYNFNIFLLIDEIASVQSFRPRKDYSVPLMDKELFFQLVKRDIAYELAKSLVD